MARPGCFYKQPTTKNPRKAQALRGFFFAFSLFKAD
jgi:hypothetical protein